MAPFVVDANVVNAFQQERVAGDPGPAMDAIDAILAASCIALDETGHCQQEWLDCAAGCYPYALADWISDMLVAQKLILFPFCNNSMHKELNNLGIPKKDHKWIRLARGSGGDAIVTEDVDLLDPAQKGNQAKAAKCKANQSGPVAKYLKRTYGIRVLCCHGVPAYLNDD